MSPKSASIKTHKNFIGKGPDRMGIQLFPPKVTVFPAKVRPKKIELI